MNYSSPSPFRYADDLRRTVVLVPRRSEQAYRDLYAVFGWTTESTAPDPAAPANTRLGLVRSSADPRTTRGDVARVQQDAEATFRTLDADDDRDRGVDRRTGLWVTGLGVLVSGLVSFGFIGGFVLMPVVVGVIVVAWFGIGALVTRVLGRWRDRDGRGAPRRYRVITDADERVQRLLRSPR